MRDELKSESPSITLGSQRQISEIFKISEIFLTQNLTAKSMLLTKKGGGCEPPPFF